MKSKLVGIVGGILDDCLDYISSLRMFSKIEKMIGTTKGWL
ncbi:hypothetical protein [Reichenbachiella agariperforans]|nr:hypothetical protein [Reichenbachiella agariperforans]